MLFIQKKILGMVFFVAFFALGMGSNLSAREVSPRAKSSGQRSKTPQHNSYTQPARQRYVGISANVGMVYVNTGYGLEFWMGEENGYQAGMELLAANETLNGGEDEGLHVRERMDLRLQQGNLFVRFPLVNVLYATVDLAVTRIRGNYGFVAQSPDVKNSFVKYEYTSIAPSFAIGSQWLFNNGNFFGLDWAGYTLPLTEKLSIDKSAKSEDTAQAYNRVALLGDKSVRGIIKKNIKDNFGPFYCLIRFGYRF